MKPCREWNGATSGAGYGQIGQGGKILYVHRKVWEESYGPIPPGMCILHACDNRRCFELTHLSLGSKADNSRDMVEKDRSAHGERNPAAKLRSEDVRTIRRELGLGVPAKVLAHRYGCDPSNISAIKHGRSWRRVS